MRRLASELDKEEARLNHPRRLKMQQPKEDDYGDESRDATLDDPDEWNLVSDKAQPRRGRQ